MRSGASATGSTSRTGCAPCAPAGGSAPRPPRRPPARRRSGAAPRSTRCRATSSCCSTCRSSRRTCRPMRPRPGVILTDLRTAHPRAPRAGRALSSGRPTGLGSHAHFWALAQAAWTGGLFCYVPARRRRRRHARRAPACCQRAAVAFHPVTPGRGRGGQPRDAARGGRLARRRGRLVSAASPTSRPATARACATPTCSSSATAPGTSAPRAWWSGRTPSSPRSTPRSARG